MADRPIESPSDLPPLDPDVPQTARIWNYILGGTDNFPADRVVGDEMKKITPELVVGAQLSRAYLARAVRYLAAEAGIRQFLDIGSGLPAAENTHQVAQSVAPDTRTVYVDYDPMVAQQAQALLESRPEGQAVFVQANLRDPDTIIQQASKTLDLDQPVALLLMGILGHIQRDQEAKSLVDGLLAHLPSGSFLATYDGTDLTESSREAEKIWNLTAKPTYHLRDPERIGAFFAGLELVEPGVVPVHEWRPEVKEDPGFEVDQYCAVARKL